jgi:hypothetical protein
MKKIISVVGAVLGALVLSTSSFADATAGASVSAARVTYTPPQAQRVAAPAWYGSESKSTEIYSTFNSDESNLYDCCIAWTVSTTASVLGAQQFIATPFTPTASATLKSIQLALSYFAGANSLTVSLAKDSGGLPGKTIKSFTVTDVPPGGSCCDVEAVAPKGVKVKAGKTYWVVVTASADTWGGVNENNINVSGTFAFDNGTGWQLTSGTLGAFRVLGK